MVRRPWLQNGILQYKREHPDATNVEMTEVLHAKFGCVSATIWKLKRNGLLDSDGKVV